MADSLVIGEQIELWGAASPSGPVASTNPLCLGATFWLQTGFDLSAPQPTTDIVGSLLLDGERPFGYRASNRTITLPIEIAAPDFATLSAAREVLLKEINQQTWTLRWTRDVTGALAGNTTQMPLLFDCFRAKSSVWQYGGIDTLGRQPIGLMTITFDALPYGRSDVPIAVSFPSPLAGMAAPPAAITVDSYPSSATTGQFLSGQNAGFDGGLGGWAAISGVTSVAASTAQVFAGSHSMAITCSGSGDAIVALQPYSAGLPVVKSQGVAVTGQVRTAVTARTVIIGVRFYDTAGNFLSSSASLGNTDSNAGWTALTWLDFATAPANGFAVPYFQVVGPAAAEVHYADSVLFGYDWDNSTVGPTGSSMLWDPSVAGVPTGIGLPAQYAVNGLAVNLEQGWTARPAQAVGVAGLAQFTSASAALMAAGDQFQLASNFLSTAGSGSVHNTDMEGSIGTWVQTGNCAVADSAVQAHAGTDSMTLTSTAGGDMSAAHCTAGNFLTQGLPVTPGQQVYCSAWFRTLASARSCNAGVSFCDVAGNVLATVYGNAVTDGAAGWIQATDNGLITAPAFAAFARASVKVQATGAGAEVHYTDDVTLAVAAAPVYTVAAVGAPFFGVNSVFFTPATNPVNVSQYDFLVQCGPAPNLTALAFYAGFGSTSYYKNWAILGGRVTFAVKLTDSNNVTLSFSSTIKCTGSNHSAAPVWQKLRIPVPSKPGFNYPMVTGYVITVTNRATNDMRYSQVFLDSLQAVPAPSGLVAPTRGFVYDLAGIQGTARAPVSLQLQNQAAATNATKTIAAAGGFAWTAPSGVTSVAVRCWGAGGNGSTVTSVGGGGGGSGATAFNAAVAVTAGVTYNGFVQPGGAGAAASTTFTGDSVTVTAACGANAAANTTTGGAAGAAGTGGFAGAAGGLGLTGTSGGGGGSSAGTAGAGNAGATGAAGGAGGAAVAGGGAGGHGHPSGGASSSGGFAPGGGGGGGNSSGGNIHGGGAGAAGQVTLTYLQPVSMTSVIAHKPPVTAPGMLSPFVSPSTDDSPAGTIEYPVQTSILGIPARFAGTYNVIAVPFSWDTPANARTVTVTVKQYEQAGGAVYSSSVAASITPNSLVQLVGPPAGTGFADLGFLTLPVQELPQDNINAYFTVTITSTDTSDRFMDILFLDTTGSTVIIQSPTGYQNYFLDEPIADRDIGLMLGTIADRDDAVSILDRASPTGTPMAVDPQGNTQLLVYSMEGAPGLQMSYFARWFFDRYA